MKSRAIVSTDSSTSEEGSPGKKRTSKIKSPFNETSLLASDEPKPNSICPLGNETQQKNDFSLHLHGDITTSSSDEANEDLDNLKVSMNGKAM